MFEGLVSQFKSLRGTTRFGGLQTDRNLSTTSFSPSADAEQDVQANSSNWLAGIRKLVPGEALAGYISFQPLAKTAQSPQNVSIILAIVFLIVTVIIRWLGSQDPDAAKPARTAEPLVVVLSALSFISLVYATGGQIFWHNAIVDQQLFGQIASAAIGLAGPVLCNRLLAPRRY